MTKGLFLSAALVLLAALPVQAMPVAPQQSGSDVIRVAGGCGVGFHRGPLGGCRRNLTPNWPCWWVRGPLGRWRLVCH